MNVTIFQINMDRDASKNAFFDQSEAQQKSGTISVDASIYDEVFSGNIMAANLEAAYSELNQRNPPTYRGRSLSISDVVLINGGAAESPGFYICNNMGFSEIDFNPNVTQKPDNLCRVVMAEPGMEAYETEIGTELEDMQKAVGNGLIEFTYPFDEAVGIVCNEEGKLIGMEGNRTIEGELYAGPIFIIGFGEEDECCSLTDEQVTRYMDMLKIPEQHTALDVENSIHIEFIGF